MRTSFLPNLSDAHECGTPQNESHPMPTRFATRRAAMTAEAQARAQVKSQVPEGDMALADLRRLTRGALAATLNINQASVAKMEKRTDMYVGTLRRFIQAMGGELDIIARFPDRSIRIDQFGE